MLLVTDPQFLSQSPIRKRQDDNSKNRGQQANIMLTRSIFIYILWCEQNSL